MAKQSRSEDEPAALATGFHQAEINQTGLGGSSDGLQNQYRVVPSLPNYNSFSLDTLLAYQPRAPPTPFAPQPVNLDYYDFSQVIPTNTGWWDYDNRTLAIDPSLGLPLADAAAPVAGYGEPIARGFQDREMDIFNEPPTPALTLASTPEGDTPGGMDQVLIPATTSADHGSQRQPPPVTCHQCPGRIFGSPRSLERHNREVHGTQVYKCRCGRCVPRKWNYIRHLGTCKFLKGFREAQRDKFVCYCGRAHADASIHMDHICSCGLQKVGRPARGGR